MNEKIFKDLFDFHLKSIEGHCLKVKWALKKFAKSKLAEELGFSQSDINDIAEAHDEDKCDPFGPFTEEYAIISGVYNGKLNPEDYPYNSKLDKATKYHIKNKRHHPEYWDNNWEPEPVKTWTERKSSKHTTANGSDMDDISIIEMVCDWKAQGISQGNTAKWWADKCKKDGRYIFKDDQWELIYEILDIVDN